MYIALVALIIGLFVIGPIAAFLIMWNSSFIHRVRIAIQTGEDANDVVWKEEKFKVIERSGYHTIVFKWMKGGAQSPPGNFWTKFLIGKNTVVNFDTPLWVKQGMRNKIARGLYLYRSIDGQFHPMNISKEGNFRVLTQDNRSFLINSDRDAQKLLMTGKQQAITLIAIVIGIIVLGLCFLFFLIYLGNNVSNLCGVATTVSQNGILEGAQAVLGG